MMPGYFIPPKKREKSLTTELNVHNSVCKYLKLLNVMFISDFAAGIKLTKGMAMRQKMQKSDHAYPDIIIFEPRGQFHGLFVELKRDHDALFNKNGTFKKSEHIDDQQICHDELRERGYFVEFACGFDEAKNLIDNYLKIS